MHSRRFSVEAFSRASSDDTRNSIVNLADNPSSAPRPLSQALADFASTSKSASKGHNRNSSLASQFSVASAASEASSLASHRSSGSEGGTIAAPEGRSPERKNAAARPLTPKSPPAAAFNSLKSMFRRSLGYPEKQLDPFTIQATRPGALDQAELQRLISERQGQIDGIVTFRMSKLSYVGYGQLAETLEFLGRSLPTLREVVLYSQVFTLEELNGLNTALSQFPHLQKLAILDSLDDPPTTSPTFSRILTMWAMDCPTLTRVQFKTDAWWEPRLTIDAELGPSVEWTEKMTTSDATQTIAE